MKCRPIFKSYLYVSSAVIYLLGNEPLLSAVRIQSFFEHFRRQIVMKIPTKTPPYFSLIFRHLNALKSILLSSIFVAKLHFLQKQV